MVNLNFYFRRQRFYHYLRYLSIFYLRKITIPFLYAGLIYLLYPLMKGGLGWTLISFSMIHYMVNLICLIILINTAVNIFTPLHQPHTAIQEYGIPISTEERFIGNFIFYGMIIFGLVYIIHAWGFLVLVLSGYEDSFYYRFILWGQYGILNIPKLFLTYTIFFAGSAYFRKSPIAKSLLVFISVPLVLSIIFNTKIWYGSTDIGQSGNFSQENQLDINQWFFVQGDTVKEIIYYLFFILWFLGSYLKIRHSEYRS